ncbi:MAG: hypothetical protein IJ899_08210 [Blautia sp.]|nr:hypothetical protein [Blautia sp.]
MKNKTLKKFLLALLTISVLSTAASICAAESAEPAEDVSESDVMAGAEKSESDEEADAQTDEIDEAADSQADENDEAADAQADEIDETADAQADEIDEATDEIDETADDASAALQWEDIQEELDKLDIEGEFINLDEAGVKIWMPPFLIADELTDEDKENGYLGYYQQEDKKGCVSILYVDSYGITLEEYAGLIDEDGSFTEIAFCKVNGMDALTYKNDQSVEVFVTFITEDEHILEFTFWPVSNDYFYTIAQIMAASIQPI